jgi:hypothetical protein
MVLTFKKRHAFDTIDPSRDVDIKIFIFNSLVVHAPGKSIIRECHVSMMAPLSPSLSLLKLG